MSTQHTIALQHQEGENSTPVTMVLDECSSKLDISIINSDDLKGSAELTGVTAKELIQIALQIIKVATYNMDEEEVVDYAHRQLECLYDPEFTTVEIKEVQKCNWT